LIVDIESRKATGDVRKPEQHVEYRAALLTDLMTSVTTILVDIEILNEVAAMKQRRFSTTALLMILAAHIGVVDAAVIQVDSDCS
jgi:hypothetical protein